VRSLERAALSSLRRLEALANGPSLARLTPPEFLSADDLADPRLGGLLERAVEARNEQVSALAGLDTCRRHELARLEYLTACLEAIPATLMELNVLECQGREQALPDSVGEADALREDLRTLRQQMTDLHA
jgi:hypothetical protein